MIGAEAPNQIDEVVVGLASATRRRPVLLWLCAGWLTLIIVVSLLANVLPLPSFVTPVGPPRQPPLQAGQLLGTDSYGRSVLSRMIFGARESLLVGVLASSAALIAGTAIGLASGYFRGPVDKLLSFGLDVLLVFPPLIVLLVLASVLQPSIPTVTGSLALIVTPTFARLARGSTLVWVDRPFVIAARAYGCPNLRLMLREVLPNALLPLLTLVPAVMAGLMIAEGALSFLGLGIPPPNPSWGGMINEGATFLRTSPWLVFTPAAAVVLTVFALNVIGEEVRSRYEGAS